MCIRDRAMARKGKRLAAEAAMPLTAKLRRKRRRWVGVRVVMSASLEAVSYTHLRAHETVLDIVCRLLLEKKHHISLLTL